MCTGICSRKYHSTCSQCPLTTTELFLCIFNAIALGTTLTAARSSVGPGGLSTGFTQPISHQPNPKEIRPHWTSSWSWDACSVHAVGTSPCQLTVLKFRGKLGAGRAPPRESVVVPQFTHSLTHSIVNSLTHSLINSLTQSFIHSLTQLLIHSLTHSLIHSRNHSFTHSLSC